MPLSQPTNRKLAHTRVVTCSGHQRDDDLWDIEGHIVDTKPYGFENRDRGGWIKPGEALHDMSIRLTIDLSLEVKDSEAVIDASPYHYCQCVSTVAKNLIGLKIAPGWTNQSKVAMGKNRGCTHLTELLGPIATTAIQTIASEKMKRQKSMVADTEQKTGNSRKGMNSPFIDSCHALAAHSPVVELHWPDQYRALSTDDSPENVT